MKNKEIEEILNELQRRKERYDYCKNNDISFSDEDYKSYLLLSYIEQLEDKINWYENIDINKTIDKFRVEHNEEIKELHNKIEQLENNRDKAIEYISKTVFNEKGYINFCYELENILKGDSE